MKKQIKVGDLVRLKKNLKVGNKYGKFGGLTLNNSMNFEGFTKVLAIDAIGCIELQMKYCNYFFTPEMLTKLK